MSSLGHGTDQVSPPVYFLSYSRKNLDDVRHFAQILLLHGIVIWQDINNLGTGISESKIRRAMREGSQGLVFFITEQSISSDIIRKIELPEADEKYRRNGTYNIVPIFGIPINNAVTALDDCLSIPISDFNGVKINDPGEYSDLLNAGHRAAELILNDVEFGHGDFVMIGLSSKQRVSGELALNLDSMELFNAGLPTEYFWDYHISAALKRVKNALVSADKKVVRLHAFCHLSLALLFGYTFRRTSGFKLEVQQSGVNHGTVWATDSDREPNPLNENEVRGDASSTNLCVTINLLSSDFLSVTSYLESASLSYRAMVKLSSENYPCTISEGQAVGIALDMTNKIKELHAKYGTDTVHLFCAIPLGLAVLIGFNMNACGTICCYEFDNARREYIPSCRLD